MPRLKWHAAGAKRYTYGVDRGVLYLPDGSAVPWNGLTSVDEDFSDVESTALYFDGIKYADSRTPGDYSGTITAYTYPEEFEPFEGMEEGKNGLLFAHQPVNDTFCMSYRTRLGNDISGKEYGYRIHILYNLTAVPDNKTSSTDSDKTEPADFSWTISGVPEPLPGHRPTAHIIIDTTKMNPYLVADIEGMLYGKDPAPPDEGQDIVDGGVPTTVDTLYVDGGTPTSAGADVLSGEGPFSAPTIPSAEEDTSRAPSLPAMADLVSLIETWTLIPITDNGDGTWTATGPDDFITMLDDHTFQIDGANATYIDSKTYDISTTHGF